MLRKSALKFSILIQNPSKTTGICMFFLPDGNYRLMIQISGGIVSGNGRSVR
jgi:hypothetical protein